MTGVNLTLLTSLLILHVSSTQELEFSEQHLLAALPRLYQCVLFVDEHS